MAGPNLSSHVPIDMYETISGNTELTQNPPQAAGQTFQAGAPIQLAAGTHPTGVLPPYQVAQVWDGHTVTTGIYGISKEAGANLSLDGSGYASNFGQQGPPWSSFNIGAPPNQPNAVTIPYGSPFVTGGVLTMLAAQDTLFTAQLDTSEVQTSITAGSLATTGIVTMTAANVHYVGEVVTLSGFTGNGAPVNGLSATVLTITGGGTGYTAQTTLTGSVIAALGTGVDNPSTVTPGQWNVGQQYGLTQDSTGSWYIDVNKRTVGSNTVLTVVGMYPGDVTQSNAFLEVPNGQLVFQFLQAAQQV